MFSIKSSPVFAQQASIIAPPKAPKTASEISKEKTEKEAQEAKQKPANERNVGDYITIGMDTINKVMDSAPVVYADSPQKLNYMV